MPDQEKRVTWVELFFDLVFVVAVTQVSGLLHDEHSWSGAGRALIVFIPIYWAWVGMTMHANLHDVDRTRARLAVFAVGLCGLFMALALPQAYESSGVLFGASYWAARLLLWKGHCSVHTRFTVPQIEAFRKKYPEGRVVAHPECTLDVVRASDESGSTEYIINTVKASPPGTIWAVATEIHLVNRLTADVPDKTIVTLDPFGCLCSTMFRVSPNHLLWVLEGLVEGRIHNRITVSEPQKSFARQALDRMLTV